MSSKPSRPPLPPAPAKVYIRMTYNQGAVLLKDKKEAEKWYRAGATVHEYDKGATHGR